MTTLLALVLAALAADPGAAASWKRSTLRIEVIPPPGEHVAPDAPVSLDLELALSLCTDDGSACRPVDMAMTGSFERPRGTGDLVVRGPRASEAPPILAGSSPDGAFADALAAAADGRPVLLDFSTRWCPPCNVLAAEVLDDPEAMAGVHLVLVDSDLPASWTLKDRYQVGAYPTVVLVDATGEELGRQVGYPGRDATLGWLSDAATTEPVAARLARLDELSPEHRGALALDLVRAGDEEGARAAMEGAEGEAVALARVALDGSPDDIRWAAAHAPAALGEHLWPHFEAVREDAALRADVLAALAPVAADPEHGVGALELCAELSEGPERALYYAAVASLERGHLTGEPAVDRGRWSGLAWALEEAGDSEGALAVLREAAAAYPDEFTYHYALAGVLARLERWGEAEVHGRAALERAEGDMDLRAATRLASILRDAGRPDEAAALLDEVLAGFDAPDEGVEVRTHRYLDQARELRDEL